MLWVQVLWESPGIQIAGKKQHLLAKKCKAIHIIGHKDSAWASSCKVIILLLIYPAQCHQNNVANAES